MNKTKVKKCWLKNVEETHPHIELPIDEHKLIGRTRDTGLADTLVSKQHLKVRADFDKKCVIIEQLGMNASVLNGITLEHGKPHTAYNGDIIEIIPSKYPYKIHFEFNEAMDSNQSTNGDIKKRRRMNDDNDSVPPVIKRLRWQIDVVKDVKLPFSNDKQWESFNKGQLIVYTMANCKASSKIAAYDMDGTLITTRSGKVFPQDVDDWKMAFGNVVKIIKEKHADDYKIVILTNQAGISSGKTKLADIKKKIENIAKALTVPIQAFIATGDNYFRKPLTGMWQTLCEQKNDSVTVSIESSYYVGDAAGRPENKAIKRKKDHSSVDRLMALNLNVTFFTPEEHFMNANVQHWIRPEFQPKDISCGKMNLIEPPTSLIASNDLEIIIMVGGPGSGKSQFCKEHLEPKNYEIVSRDVIGTWQKCVDRLNDCIRAKRKVVIDNTNGDIESRARYINAAKKYKVPCRCFVMNTSFKHAEHNIAFRELTDSKHSKISKLVLNSYKKHFKEPTLEEGFVEIVRVNFIPSFQSDKERSLYEMYLLST